MKSDLVADLRQASTLRATVVTPRIQRLLAEAANQIELITGLLHDRERKADEWRRRAITAEGKVRAKGSNSA